MPRPALTLEELDEEIGQHEAEVIQLKARLYDEETILAHLRAMRGAVAKHGVRRDPE